MKEFSSLKEILDSLRSGKVVQFRYEGRHFVWTGISQFRAPDQSSIEVNEKYGLVIYEESSGMSIWEDITWFVNYYWDGSDLHDLYELAMKLLMTIALTDYQTDESQPLDEFLFEEIHNIYLVALREGYFSGHPDIVEIINYFRDHYSPDFAKKLISTNGDFTREV